jgi:hypothetical protein
MVATYLLFSILAGGILRLVWHVELLTMERNVSVLTKNPLMFYLPLFYLPPHSLWQNLRAQRFSLGDNSNRVQVRKEYEQNILKLSRLGG